MKVGLCVAIASALTIMPVVQAAPVLLSARAGGSQLTITDSLEAALNVFRGKGSSESLADDASSSWIPQLGAPSRPSSPDVLKTVKDENLNPARSAGPHRNKRLINARASHPYAKEGYATFDGPVRGLVDYPLVVHSPPVVHSPQPPVVHSPLPSVVHSPQQESNFIDLTYSPQQESNFIDLTHSP